MSMDVGEISANAKAELAYATERTMRFRLIGRLVTTRAPHTIRSSDRASEELETYLEDLGLFAGVVYCTLPMDYVLTNLALLTAPGFPLEGYARAFEGSEIVESITGTVAELKVLVAYRAKQRQLIVAISGTANWPQTCLDFKMYRHRPNLPGWDHKASVHKGFWTLYKGIRNQCMQAIKHGFSTYDVGTLAIVGHSLGAALSSLLILDVMIASARSTTIVPKGVKISTVSFGSPRCGNKRLGRVFWPQVLKDYLAKNGKDSFEEFSVKAFNDGVPALPPTLFGYRHFLRNSSNSTNLFFFGGRMYHVPSNQNEHSLFRVQLDEDVDEPPVDMPRYPKGGHNLYNGRDLERMHRRMIWFDEFRIQDSEGWQDHYLRRVQKHEDTPEPARKKQWRVLKTHYLP